MNTAPPLLFTSSFSLHSVAVSNHQGLLSEFTSIVEERLKQFEGSLEKVNISALFFFTSLIIILKDDELKDVSMNVEFTITASNKN